MFNPITSVRSWLSNWPASEFPRVFGSGASTSTGVSVSEYSALNYSAFWAAVSIISADMASMPLILYKRTSNGGKERHTGSRLYELLHDAPNPEMGAMVFRETLQAHVLIWGNAYAEIERDGLGRPVALWPLTPDRVTPYRDDRTRQLFYRVTQGRGGQVIVSPGNMLHIPGLGFDGVTGYSVVQMARESIGLGLATERFGGTFFGNGSTFGGVLSHPQNLTKEVKQDIRDSLDAVHQGVDRAHKFVILGGGMKYDKLGIPPNDAQFLETRKFQITEMARWFPIPPHKIGDLERATFSNIEEQNVDYHQSSLNRWEVRWEQELNRKLIPPLERKQQFFKHNADAFLRGDSPRRAAFYTAMFNIGVYSINMILESEDLNKIGPEGDVHFVQGNLSTAERLMEAPVAPAPVVTDITPKPKELGPSDEDEDENTRALHATLGEIAENTAALKASIAAERDALSQAERDAQRARVAQLEAERDHLQQTADELRSQLDQQRTTHETAIAAVRSDVAAERGAREAAETARAEADQAREAATVEGAEARAARDVAEQRASEDARTRATAESAHAEAAAALEAQRAAETSRLTGMVTAHRALIVQVIGRLVRRETDRARRHQLTPEKLRHWMRDFYPTHQDSCLEELRPAIRAHLAWKQSTEDVDVVTARFVEAHLAESQRQLTTVLDGSPEDLHANLEKLLLRWESERPGAVADAVLHDEVEYLRSLGAGNGHREPVTEPPAAPVMPTIVIHNHPAAGGRRSMRLTRGLDGTIESIDEE